MDEQHNEDGHSATSAMVRVSATSSRAIVGRSAPPFPSLGAAMAGTATTHRHN
jgi:hypothetical protein